MTERKREKWDFNAILRPFPSTLKKALSRLKIGEFLFDRRRIYNRQTFTAVHSLSSCCISTAFLPYDTPTFHIKKPICEGEKTRPKSESLKKSNDDERLSTVCDSRL